VFARGEYEPATRSGQRLIAHELAHVLQQHGSAPLAVQRQADAEGVADEVTMEPTEQHVVNGRPVAATAGVLTEAQIPSPRPVQSKVDFSLPPDSKEV
jgi:Domain of unknown function (DUF4157)